MINLKRQNYYAAFAHLGSFIILLILYNHYNKSKKYARSQTFRYSVASPTDASGLCNSNKQAVSGDSAGRCTIEPLYTVPQKTAFSFNNIHLCLLFFALTSLAHFFYATNGFGSGLYMYYVNQGFNPFRWVEYGISAGIMILIIAHSLGINDANHLLSLVLINFALQSCGYIVENSLKKGNQINESVIKGATFAGWCLLIASWAPILIAFTELVTDVNTKFKDVEQTEGPDAGKKIKVPGFVWFILIVQILNYSSFGFIQAGQVRDAFKGTLKPYSAYESKYLKLSFAGKIGLASGIAYGLIFRTKTCP
jgi:hypothetical protein